MNCIGVGIAEARYSGIGIMLLGLVLPKCSSSFQQAGFAAPPCQHWNRCHPSSTIDRSYSTSRQARRKNDDQQSATLDWESFEFGKSPKWDRRFDGEISIADAASSKEDAMKVLYEKESIEDGKFAAQLNAANAAWQKLDPAIVERGIQVLLPYVRPDRVERIETVLKQRTGHTRFLFENPANPSNVFACLRTIEAFGIQHVDLVVESAKFKGKSALSQKRGMRTAMGSAQWLSLAQYSDTKTALEDLKQSHRIVVSDLQESQDIRNLDWSHPDDDRPICIVMGNEEDGISDEMRQAADVRFRLPMVGFAESFNLSVATAITLAHLSAASAVDGPIRPGDLPQRQIRCLLLKGLLNSVAQKRMALILLKDAGIPHDILRML